MEYSSRAIAAEYLRPRKIPSTACSGCGLGMNHKVVVQAIKELGIEVPEVVWGTSIGCAGRQTFATWKGDGFAGTHGRVYAIARSGGQPGHRATLNRRARGTNPGCAGLDPHRAAIVANGLCGTHRSRESLNPTHGQPAEGGVPESETRRGFLPTEASAKVGALRARSSTPRLWP